jgi:hypothetical protein
MTIQTAPTTLRELTVAETGLVAGGQTAVEMSLSSSFLDHNGIRLDNGWGYTDTGEWFQDRDCNNFYDTVYADLGGGDWVVSYDAGAHWQRTGHPDYYHEVDCDV